MIRCPFEWKILGIILFFPAVAQSLTINPGNAWGGIFAGKVTEYEISLSGEQNSYASLTWKLILKGRTLSMGRQDIRFSSGESVTATLPLQAPALKPGISLEAELIVELANVGQSNDKVRYESKLNIYGPDALLSNKGIYRQLNIQLFDSNGKTSKIFDDLEIPYEARSKAKITSVNTRGLIVVGAGVAFDRQRGLMDALIERAEAGQHILILQPVSGAFPVSELSADSKRVPSTMSFADDSIVQSFANGYHWISDPHIKSHGLSLHGHRQAVLVKIVEPDKGGWDWVDINYGQSGGRFIVCMLPFDRDIYQSPVPQIILGRLLAYANGQLSSLTSTTKGNNKHEE